MIFSKVMLIAVYVKVIKLYYVNTDYGLRRSHTLGTDFYSAAAMLFTCHIFDGADRFFSFFM